MIALVARHQLVAFRRQKVLGVMLATLLAMTALAVAVGWSSHNTIGRVYAVGSQIVAAQGKTAPPNPFDLQPTLSMLSNVSIYMAMVGALLAIVVGHLSLADERSAGIGRLVHSRPVGRREHAVGKAVAVAVALGMAVAASLVVTAIAVPLVNGALPSAGEYLRLVLFHGVTWLYLVVFGLVGMAGVLLVDRRSMALLASMAVWLVVTFAVPQFTSGLNPVSSLNPVTEPVGTSQPFFAATAHARGLSVFEQYKAAGSHILQTGSPEPVATTALRLLPLLGAAGGLALLVDRLARSHDWSKGAGDE